jgi:hypothetical protein
MLDHNNRRALAAPALAIGCAVLLGLAGCTSDLTRSFGFTRNAPDEFQVTTRAPLSMPPDYTLRPPQPGASRPQEMTASRAAESALVPQAALTPAPGAGGAAATSGEQALVAAAGAPAPANIRNQVDQDQTNDVSNRTFTDKLMFWKRPEPTANVQVDPQKEADRLRANAALGQSVDAGQTPIIQQKPKSIFERLFGWL